MLRLLFITILIFQVSSSGETRKMGGGTGNLKVTTTESLQSTATAPVNGEARIGERWAKLWSEKQLDSLIEMYAPDAVFLTGQGARITGRPAIRALFKTAFDQINPQLSVHNLSAEQADSLAYESGEYTETLTPVAGGPGRNGKGNYVIILRRGGDGKWMIIQHVWNDVPVTP